MLDFFNEIDTRVFIFLNSQHNGFFDFIMWWLSDKLIWIPLYLILLYFLIKNYKWEALPILLTLAILIALSDQASGFIKDSVGRLRPSHNSDIQNQVHTLNGYLGGSYGFVSSHASNSFALALFLSHFLKNKIKHFAPLIFTWAALVSYSRIYLGVHFPGDIIGGILLGFLLAWMMVNIYKRIIKKTCFSGYC